MLLVGYEELRIGNGNNLGCLRTFGTLCNFEVHGIPSLQGISVMAAGIHYPAAGNAVPLRVIETNSRSFAG